MDSLQKVFLYLLVFLNIAVPVTTWIVSGKLANRQLSQIYTVYPEDESPSPSGSRKASASPSVSPSPSTSSSPSPSPSSTTVCQELTADTNTVALWHMNNSWDDSSTNGNNGSASNATFTSDAKVGDYAGNFNGSKAYVKVGNTEALKLANTDFTWEMWVYMKSYDTSYGTSLLEKRVGNNAGYFFTVGGAKSTKGMITCGYKDSAGNNYYVASSNTVPLDTWTHIACVFENSSKTMTDYINGSYDNSSVLSGTIATNSDSVTLGAFGDHKKYFLNGFLDEVRISNVARTATEIAADASCSTASPSPSASTTASGISIKATFQGLPTDSQNIAFTLVTSDNSWAKEVIMNSDGTFPNFDFTGLDMTKSYNFVLYAHPYLTSVKTIDLSAGAQTVDFGEIRTGDLNGDNQVNTLDWSLMKLNFGVDGDQ